MVKTYNCSCNRNMYLWWCSNVYKRFQSFIWRYFYCAFLRFCLAIVIDSNVQPGVGKFGCIWREWFARGQGIWFKIFDKSQIPILCPASPPPPRRYYIDRCIKSMKFSRCNYLIVACKVFKKRTFPLVHIHQVLIRGPNLSTWQGRWTR